MNAPDKIYLHGYDFDKEPCVKWHEKPMEKGMRGYHVVNVEYIRKDLILGWLNGVKSDPMIPMNIDKVIDYIKAL